MTSATQILPQMSNVPFQLPLLMIFNAISQQRRLNSTAGGRRTPSLEGVYAEPIRSKQEDVSKVKLHELEAKVAELTRQLTETKTKLYESQEKVAELTRQLTEAKTKLYESEEKVTNLTQQVKDTNAMLDVPDAGVHNGTAHNMTLKMDNLTVPVGLPYFAQSPTSYMTLNPLGDDAFENFSIKVTFKPDSPDGLILYNAQRKGREGDFISFGLNNSYVEFRFNLGSGPAVIRSADPIRIGEWHTVEFSRKRNTGKMYVDGDGPFSGRSPGQFKCLDLVEPLYIGGVPNFSEIHELNGFNRGFVGCISLLSTGSVDQELVPDDKSHGVTACKQSCAANLCENNGVCQEATEGYGYNCICPEGFAGLNCDYPSDEIVECEFYGSYESEYDSHQPGAEV